MKKIIIKFCFLFCFLVAAKAYAELQQVPGVLSAPVVLYDEGSNILSDGQYPVVIAFKDSLGSTLFSEEQTVDVRKGVALISIGSGYAVGSGFSTSSGGLDVSTFDVGTDVSVEILVEGQSKPQEITILGSQPYAFMAQKAVSVSNDAITSSQIRDGSIHEEDLDEALLESLKNASSTAPNSSGNASVVKVDASQVQINSVVGLNNAKSGSLDSVLNDLDASIDALRGTDLTQSLSSVNAKIDAHVNSKSKIHGATGDVVGTTDSQTLKNKTIDSSNSIAAEAIKSGTISDDRIPSGITRDIELEQAISNATASITALTVDDQISPPLKPLAHGYISGEASGFQCNQMSIKASYNVDHIVCGSLPKKLGISLKNPLAQKSDLIVIVNPIGGSFGCTEAVPYHADVASGTTDIDIVGSTSLSGSVSASFDCNSYMQSSFSFVVYQIPK